MEHVGPPRSHAVTMNQSRDAQFSLMENGSRQECQSCFKKKKGVNLQGIYTRVTGRDLFYGRVYVFFFLGMQVKLNK